MTHNPTKDQTPGAVAKGKYINKLLENIPEEPYSDEFITELKQHALSLMDKNGEDRMFSVDPIEMLRLIATIELSRNTYLSDAPESRQFQEVKTPEAGESGSAGVEIAEAPAEESIEAPVLTPDTQQPNVSTAEEVENTSMEEVKTPEAGELVQDAEASASVRGVGPEESLLGSQNGTPPTASTRDVTSDVVPQEVKTPEVGESVPGASDSVTAPGVTLQSDTNVPIAMEQAIQNLSLDSSDENFAPPVTEPDNIEDDLAGV